MNRTTAMKSLLTPQQVSNRHHHSHPHWVATLSYAKVYNENHWMRPDRQLIPCCVAAFVAAYNRPQHATLPNRIATVSPASNHQILPETRSDNREPVAPSIWSKKHKSCRMAQMALGKVVPQTRQQLQLHRQQLRHLIRSARVAHQPPPTTTLPTHFSCSTKSRMWRCRSRPPQVSTEITKRRRIVIRAAKTGERTRKMTPKIVKAQFGMSMVVSKLLF